MQRKFVLRDNCIQGCLVLAFLFLIGCKKNIPKYYYIKYKADGIQQTDTSAALAILYANDSASSYNAQLFARNTTSSSILYLIVYSKTPLNTSTSYVDTINSLGTPVTIDYFTSSYAYPNYPTLSSVYLVPNKVVVHFNNISPATVEGTFSGNIAASDSSKVTVITDGEFYLKVR